MGPAGGGPGVDAKAEGRSGTPYSDKGAGAVH